MLTAWDALYLLAGTVVGPLYAVRNAVKGKRFPRALGRFLGRTADGVAHGHAPVWFHGVSVGEISVAGRIAEQLAALTGISAVLSTTTATGLRVARARYPDVPVFYFPLDFSWAVRRIIRKLRPRMLVLVEAELWPNLLRVATRVGVPVVLVNARMSDRSYRRLRCLRPLARHLLQQLAFIAAQNDTFARRFRELGADPDRLAVTGSLKFDGLSLDRRNPRTEELSRLFGLKEEELVLVAGSTSAPEEEYALRAYLDLKRRYRQLRLVIVPRHPERFDSVAELVERTTGRLPARRSELHGGAVADSESVILVDTLGELVDVWGLADVGFVGGSFAPRGGQSMLEPAAYGVPTCFGPCVWNYRDAADMLVRAGAARLVHSYEELVAALDHYLADESLRAVAGERARALIASQQGATRRTCELLARLLGFAGGATAGMPSIGDDLPGSSDAAPLRRAG